jgi:hypothetical protein
MILDIDNRAVVVFTNKLEKIGKSALPVAIRTALNSAAFDVKQNTMPRSALRFIHRTENFFKANSRVEMAKGWAIRDMKSIIGFTSEHLRIGSTNFAVKDLEQQEYSGSIGGKTFIPLNPARVGGSFNRVVRPVNRLSVLNKQKIIDAGKVRGTKGAFIAAAHKAGAGGLVLGNQSKEIIWRINSIVGSKINMTPLYTVKSGRSVKVGETGFMRFASFQSANKLESFYIQEAEKQIDKFIK